MEPDRELLEQSIGRIEAMEAIAERILSDCRVTLMMTFRFLDRALWKMPYESLRFATETPMLNASARTALSTDGNALYYNAKAVISAFKANPDLVIRSYLHALLHCIFRHPFKTVRAEPDLWSLACDICAEAIALEMCDGRFALEGDRNVRLLVERVMAQCSGLTPSKVYRALLLGKREGGDADQIRLYAELNGHGELFARDDHHLWDLSKPPADGQAGQNPPQGGESSKTGDPNEKPGGSQDAQPGEAPDSENAESSADPGADAGPPDEGESGEEDGNGQRTVQDDARPAEPDGSSAFSLQREDAPGPAYSEGDMPESADTGDGGSDEEDWEHIAKQIETELRTMEKMRGDGAGTFMGNLSLANRSRIDYADFLHRFATRVEDAILNDEEFDFIFYTYGLKLYGNMPLVEPLEYTETDRVREFVIAIDTSGSCSRGLIQTFITRTYEILSRSRAFDERVNIHIVQCDAKVQSIEIMSDIADLAAFANGFEVRGYGGTDFRPVFAYVDELIAHNEFVDLKGLIYFTDGYGTFPAQAPGYDVAFVFVEEDGKDRRVPPWAMKVILDEDTLYEMERDS